MGKTYWLVIALGLLGFVAAASHADGRDNKIARSVRFLQMIKPRTTYAQFKRLTPSGVRLSDAKWSASEFALGTYVEMSGKLEGLFVFLSDIQRKRLRTHKGSELNSGSIQVVPSDTLDVAMLHIAENSGEKLHNKKIRKIIEQLTNLLGKPASKKLQAEDGPDSGWHIVWKLSGRRRLEMTEDATVHLILSFDYSQRR